MTKLELTLMAFVKSIDEELSVTFDTNDGYCYNTLENRININLSQTDDCGFLRHLKEFHNCPYANEIHLALWSILHEIGHYETENDVEEYDEDYETRIYLMLTDKRVRNNPLIQNKYFNLPAEFMATEWAKEWVDENFSLAKKMSEMLTKVCKG